MKNDNNDLLKKIINVKFNAYNEIKNKHIFIS